MFDNQIQILEIVIFKFQVKRPVEMKLNVLVLKRVNVLVARLPVMKVPNLVVRWELKWPDWLVRRSAEKLA